MKFIRKLTKFFNTSKHSDNLHKIPRTQHGITLSAIPPNVRHVLEKLTAAGFEAYLVGGGVRDLLLNQQPKDFDIATDAKPEQVRKLFRNCRLIGRRFRLAHIYFGQDIIEVATFRGDHTKGSAAHGKTQAGLIIRDNVYGSLEEDAWRRDFTVNALYYDLRDESLLDHTGGFAHLQAKQLHIIGEPIKRYREDPVRMLRAARFAAKLDFVVDKQSSEPIKKQSEQLKNIPSARLFEEFLKLFLSGHAQKTFEHLVTYQLFDYLFPLTAKHLNNPEFKQFIQIALRNTDNRLNTGKSVNPAFLLSVLLWQPVQEAAKIYRRQRLSEAEAQEQAIYDVLKLQSHHLAIPRRFTTTMQEIWSMQRLFNRRHDKKVYRLMSHERFRAAYDFLLLRGEVDKNMQPLAAWWEQFVTSDESTREQLLANVNKKNPRSQRTPDENAD